MEKTCKNCKYYKPTDYSYFDSKRNLGGECFCDEFIYNAEEDKIIPVDNKLKNYNTDKYCVGKNFGCIYFKNK